MMNANPSELDGPPVPTRSFRESYKGAIAFNSWTYFIPALYGTLAKLWVAQIDSSSVVLTDVWTYMSIFTEVVNEGLSRVAFNVIGNRGRKAGDRLQLCTTLIAVQCVLGLVLSIIFALAAPEFASAFVPVEVRSTSITYVRIASFSSFFSVLSYAIEASTRSLDRPDVPLWISLSKTTLNIAFDLIFLSSFRVSGIHPTVNTQGSIRLACDGAGAVAGLLYFLYTASKTLEAGQKLPKPTLQCLKTLAKPARFTFLESAIRNGLYLWQITVVVSLGSDYATAWGVFNTIRWGVVMVPALAMEQAAVTFVAHRWGEFSARFPHAAEAYGRLVAGDVDGDDAGVMEADAVPQAVQEVEAQSDVFVGVVAVDRDRKEAWAAGDGGEGEGEGEIDNVQQAVPSNRDLLELVKPALHSCAIILIVEALLALILSLWVAQPFAFYLSNSDPVADLATKMFRSLDWCYILFTLSMPLTAILLATRFDVWFINALIPNIIWVLPWCIVSESISFDLNNAWTYHSVIFGGSLVVGFVVVLISLYCWVCVVKTGWQPYLKLKAWMAQCC